MIVSPVAISPMVSTSLKGGKSYQQGITHYWPLDEDSGDAIDIVGGNNGAVTGATQDAAGKVNKSYSFGGTDYITLDLEGTLIDLTTTDFSLFMWVKRATTGVLELLFDLRDAGTDGFAFLFPTSNIVRAAINTGIAGAAIDSATSIEDTNWHLIGVTCDREGDAQIYIDGSADGSPIDISTSGDIEVTNGAKIATRNFSTPTSHFTGNIDEILLYNRVVTPEEVAALWNEGNGIAVL